MEGTIITTGISAADLLEQMRAIVRYELNEHRLNPTGTVADAEEQLLTVKDASTLLNVTVHTIHSWKQAGKLPYLKMGSRTYFKRSELLSSLQNQQRTTKKAARKRG